MKLLKLFLTFGLFISTVNSWSTSTSTSVDTETEIEKVDDRLMADQRKTSMATVTSTRTAVPTPLVIKSNFNCTDKGYGMDKEKKYCCRVSYDKISWPDRGRKRVSRVCASRVKEVEVWAVRDLLDLKNVNLDGSPKEGTGSSAGLYESKRKDSVDLDGNPRAYKTGRNSCDNIASLEEVMKHHHNYRRLRTRWNSYKFQLPGTGTKENEWVKKGSNFVIAGPNKNISTYVGAWVLSQTSLEYSHTPEGESFKTDKELIYRDIDKAGYPGGRSRLNYFFEHDQRRVVNSLEVPFAVAPSCLLQNGVSFGSTVRIRKGKDGPESNAVYADGGPLNSLGEASSKVFLNLEIPRDDLSGCYVKGEYDRFFYLIFKGSKGKANTKNEESMKSSMKSILSEKYEEDFGGEEAYDACIEAYESSV